MKLIYCPVCNDVRALRSKPCVCSCGKSGGWAESLGSTAFVTGEAKVLAFSDTYLRVAVEDTGPEHCKAFTAYAIHDTSHTVERI